MTGDPMLAANVYVLSYLDRADCEKGDCKRLASISVEVGLTDGETLNVPLCRTHALAFIEHVLYVGRPAKEWAL